MKDLFCGMMKDTANEVKPNGMSITMFLTYIVNLLTLFLFLFTFSPLMIQK